MCDKFQRLCDPDVHPTLASTGDVIVNPDAGEGGLEETDLLLSATQNQSISVDGNSVTRRSISELIALDKHLAGKRSSNRGGGWGSVGIARGIPPSANGL